MAAMNSSSRRLSLDSVSGVSSFWSTLKSLRTSSGDETLPHPVNLSEALLYIYKSSRFHDPCFILSRWFLNDVSVKGQAVYKSKQVRDKQINRTLGQVPIIAAAAILKTAEKPPVLPLSSLSYAENLLCMMDSVGNRSYKPNPLLARLLDIIFILYAEHEMNCPTAAARHLASSGVDVYTAIAGAVGSLCDPLHGAAIENVSKMLSRH